MLQSTIEHKKQSLIATTLLFVLLLLLLFIFNFNTQIIVPELEGGGGGGDIAVNFGNSDQGMGDNTESVELQQAKTQKQIEPETPAESKVTNASDNETPTISETKKQLKTPTKPITKPVEIVKPKVSKTTNDALSNILNANAKSGDGDDNVAGNKGKSNGSSNSSGYNGGGGLGTGTGGGNGSGQGLGTGSGYGTSTGSGRGNGSGNYQLSGRKAISKPNPKYTCNEQGVVVVQIEVNNLGQVTAVTSGIKGTTNTAKCLTDQAKIAAQNTKFDANSNAPEKQVGKIIYNFKLTE